MGGQHIKTMAGDHGPKYEGDAIVIRCGFPPNRVGRRFDNKGDAVKSPVALSDPAWVASGRADSTELAKRP
jgi:hypothetical protein